MKRDIGVDFTIPGSFKSRPSTFVDPRHQNNLGTPLVYSRAFFEMVELSLWIVMHLKGILISGFELLVHYWTGYAVRGLLLDRLICPNCTRN